MPPVAPMTTPPAEDLTESESSNITYSDTPVTKSELLDQALSEEIDVRIELDDGSTHSTYCFFSAVAAAFGSLCAALMARAETLLIGLPRNNALTAHFWLFIGMGASNWMLWKYYSKALEISDFWRATLTMAAIAMGLAAITGHTVLNDSLALVPYCMGLCFTASMAPIAYDLCKFLKSWKEERSKAKAE